ncbi:SOS response-associated peptidase [Streptomyces albidus (ex Kaewkla and Franco 2022)]|uniref:SOS response-associated peptidase n=1 Tax=Streptomyces albidus (ex Kaewkla and Franco 2022) TaxID=722709 RepID=UPI0015EF60CF|nr:SOS response-associated peptidase [Streptomyces albidus (ex Kaewkla and Franco 2022)]
MCGRYAASRRPEDLVALFGVEKWDPQEALAPDWNVAPTKQVHAVLDRPVKGSGDPRPVRQLRSLTWGLVPGWAQSPDLGAKMINARAETVHEKPAFRRPFATRRCLIPADGYFEWVTAKGELQLEQEGKKKRTRKQPYFVSPADGSVMAMAGLYEFWRDGTLPDDHPQAWRTTCTVVTTEAEREPLAEPSGEDGPASLSEIHPRMPLMLLPERWDDWLNPARQPQEELRELLAPPPPGRMRAHPVSTDVSNVRNNRPDLLEALTGPEVGTLF